MKKSKTKKKDAKQDQKKPEKPAVPATAEETTENPFDFGGLPNRDLKKNLGCG
ncbi:MAG: hypothetical protein QY309_16770 [Cyclobacteriaceae bacterium]|nr:MAG: hypothetical protein QY309_16770 [Cyclobacteriaceae bacterium]